MKENVRNTLSFILDRLQEPSTWRGIVLLATAAGAAYSPEDVESIVALGLAIAGAVGVMTRDKK